MRHVRGRRRAHLRRRSRAERRGRGGETKREGEQGRQEQACIPAVRPCREGAQARKDRPRHLHLVLCEVHQVLALSPTHHTPPQHPSATAAAAAPLLELTHPTRGPERGTQRASAGETSAVSDARVQAVSQRPLLPPAACACCRVQAAPPSNRPPGARAASAAASSAECGREGAAGFRGVGGTHTRMRGGMGGGQRRRSAAERGGAPRSFAAPSCRARRAARCRRRPRTPNSSPARRVWVSCLVPHAEPFISYPYPHSHYPGVERWEAGGKEVQCEMPSALAECRLCVQTNVM